MNDFSVFIEFKNKLRFHYSTCKIDTTQRSICFKSPKFSISGLIGISTYGIDLKTKVNQEILLIHTYLVYKELIKSKRNCLEIEFTDISPLFYRLIILILFQ